MSETLDEKQLSLLVYGFALVISKNNFVVPDTVLNIIHHYVPKAYWLKAGENIEINDESNTIETCNTGWSTAYSTAQAVVLQKHKFIWQIKILKCGEGDDIRIGIASNMNELDDEFANSEDGHNYSYVTYANAAVVGYNGEFESKKIPYYGIGDIVTIELNLNDRIVSYYNNKKFVHKQTNIVKTNYRLAAAMYGCVSIKIISFQRIFINE
eukprot:426520_1